MTTLLPILHQRIFILSVLSAALLFAEGGCKPSPPASTGQATPPADNGSPRQPTARDFQVFFQGLLPASVKVAEIKVVS